MHLRKNSTQHSASRFVSPPQKSFLPLCDPINTTTGKISRNLSLQAKSTPVEPSLLNQSTTRNHNMLSPAHQNDPEDMEALLPPGLMMPERPKTRRT